LEELTALMGRANSVDKVMKLSYHSKLPKLRKLVTRRCSSKLLFPLAHSITVYCCLDDKVDDVACAAYAVI
jgi:hypothetical protein